MLYSGVVSKADFKLAHVIGFVPAKRDLRGHDLIHYEYNMYDFKTFDSTRSNLSYLQIPIRGSRKIEMNLFVDSYLVFNRKRNTSFQLVTKNIIGLIF